MAEPAQPPWQVVYDTCEEALKLLQPLIEFLENLIWWCPQYWHHVIQHSSVIIGPLVRIRRMLLDLQDLALQQIRGR